MNLVGCDGSTASLIEIRAFADSVGYPVMLKGKGQGATLCAGWQEVRVVVSTQAWAQNGFIQRVVRGWERCLAFAAYQGVMSGK
jgi:pyruvate carboxylase